MEKDTNRKEKALSAISLKSFILVSVMLLIILALSGAMSYFIPQGKFSYDENGAIIPNTFVLGQVKGIEIWRVITAPFRVFAGEDSLTIIMISIFLLVMAGIFNVMEKTQGVHVLIKRCVTAFSHRKRLVLCIAIFVFMLFGSFFGMFEELVTLLPIVMIFMLSLRYDTLTGLGVCMLSACFGFSAAITNPFSVGLAAEVAGVAVYEGVWLRLVFFALIFAVLCAFILLHTKKITANPQKSLTYDIDREKLLTLNFNASEQNPNEAKLFKTYAIFFGIELIILILIASIRAISGYAIPILAATFLIGGIISGLIVCENKKQVFIWFGKGALGMLPAVFMIMLATSVKLVLDESQIIDTIMNWAITTLSGQNKFVCVLLIYLLILFLQIFIGSASAKIMLIMPIIMPICTALGISPATVILTYCIADGFTDMILPTNPVLLIGLSMANVSYGKWIKWTWLLQLIILALTVLILLFAVAINY
ncbi:MAG: YfcC family protein [Clostridia bacterium]|nr:YfcC family protein [Clostridia bacterium]